MENSSLYLFYCPRNKALKNIMAGKARLINHRRRLHCQKDNKFHSYTMCLKNSKFSVTYLKKIKDFNRRQTISIHLHVTLSHSQLFSRMSDSCVLFQLVKKNIYSIFKCNDLSFWNDGVIMFLNLTYKTLSRCLAFFNLMLMIVF